MSGLGGAIGITEQKTIMGLSIVDDIEIVDAACKSHKSLVIIIDEYGVEHDILRDNMPFGSPSRSKFGT